MPSRWEVTLTGAADDTVSPTALQAVVSGWLDEPPPGSGLVPQVGARSVHTAPARAWACGPIRACLPADMRACLPADMKDKGAVTVLEICLLEDALAGRLCSATRPGRRVRLGAYEYRTVASAREVSRTSWEDLQRWSGERAWQVHFVTPVCVRRGNRTSPWPAPESIARGLAERWHRVHPATAPSLSVRRASGIWVSDVDGRSEVHILARPSKLTARRRLTEEVISGFVGRIRYVCDHGTEAEAADFGALLAFAAYGGAGSHTTYGFGVVRPEPTWQPPTVRPGPSCTG